jgi:sugar phosphate isomerase/epimerase
MKTRTGNYPIGFRRNNSDWQKDLGALLDWAVAEDLEVLDITAVDAPATIKAIQEAGLHVGSIDLATYKGMLSPDAGERAEAVAMNAELVRATAPLGKFNYFCVMLPEDPSRPRAENFGYLVETYSQLAPVVEEAGGRIVIEGWPGPGALACTPEGYRAVFREVSSPVMGINFDPSHLIRQGIDPLRFLREFVDRVYHIHGKDTELLAENQYEYGTEQPPTFYKPPRFSGTYWRYTIPGHGLFRWSEGLRILTEKGYNGYLSIELEDSQFNDSVEAEKLGIVQGAGFLRGC